MSGTKKKPNVTKRAKYTIWKIKKKRKVKVIPRWSKKEEKTNTILEQP